MGKESGFSLVEKLIAPFHNMSIVLTAVSALSLHVCLTQLFEPLIHIYYALLLTFPLTVGLLIVLLVFFNTNWKDTSFATVIMSPVALALLFLLLTGISDKYGLEKKGREEQKEKAIAHDDRVTTPASVLNNGQSAKHLHELVTEMSLQDSVAKAALANPPWYTKIAVTRNIASASFYLVQQFKRMYHDYGPTRFISGVVLAFLLAWYIQEKGINRLTGKTKEAEK